MSRKLSRLPVQSPLDITERGDISDGNCYWATNNDSWGHDSVSFDCIELGFATIAFFRFLPPVKSYYRALEAIRKAMMTYWVSVNYERERKDVTEYACITNQDIGFFEVIQHLRKRKMLKELQIKEVEKLQFNRVSPWISTPKKAEVWNLLFEWNPKVEIPQGVEWLSVVTHGAKEHVCGSYIGERAPYALKRDIENNLKKELAYYIFSFVIIWMVINTFLILYVNLCR